MNDKELVSRMQHGDMQAFDELYERYKDDAYRLACLITGSRTDGEDLAQEAFVTCAQSIKSLRDGSKFRPWLLRTLSRAAWKYCRKAKRETPVSELWEQDGVTYLISGFDTGLDAQTMFDMAAELVK